MPKTRWTIQMKPPFKGLAPAWYANSYPSYGNMNQAGDMTSVDQTDPSKMTQGPAPNTLTNGTQAGAFTTNAKFILEVPTASDTTYAIGGDQLYQISSTAVTNAGSWPHTIDKAAVTGEDGESIIADGDNLFYFYNHSGGAGDIGKYNGSTFDDDWGSTTPATGAATLQNAPHPALKGPDGRYYFGNGRYVGYYDPVTDTLSVDELDLYEDSVVIDIVFERNLLWIAANSPNNTGSNQNRGFITVWDTQSESFQEPFIEIIGSVGGLITKNGSIFAFYQDLGSSAFKLGFIQGDTIQPVPGATFTGSLPNFGQKTVFKNHIAWMSNQDIYMWGAADETIPLGMTKYAQSTYSTTGALGNPFGSLITCSESGANYDISSLSGYATGNWKSVYFNVPLSVIDKVKIVYETTASGAEVDVDIEYDRGTTVEIGTINHTNDSGSVFKVFEPQLDVTGFRLNLDWSDGSATNPLSINYIEISGHTKEQQ